MLVIAKNAEEHFLRLLEDPKREQPSARCFHIKFSELDMEKPLLLRRFLAHFQSVPNTHRARVYFCADGDVLILMRGLLQRQFNYFIAALSQQLTPHSLEGITRIYDMELHHGAVTELLYAKHFAIQRMKQAAHQKQKEQLAHEITQMLAELDGNLIRTLSVRRAQRIDALALIVDDDMTSRTLARYSLGKTFHPHVAFNGRDAIIQYVTHAPDVMFLDIGLPDIDGHRILEIIFRIDPEAYVIMFSGKHDEENVLRALKAGAQGFVCKPFTQNALKQYAERSPFIINRCQAIAEELMAGLEG